MRSHYCFVKIKIMTMSSKGNNNQETVDKKKIREERFEEMKTVQAILSEEFKFIQNEVKKFNILDNDDLEKYILYLPRKRFKKSNKTVRAYFVKKIYEYVTECAKLEGIVIQNKAELDILFNRQIPFILELTILVQYLHNHILDQKYEVKNAISINQSLIASNILKELTFDYVTKKITNRKILLKTYNVLRNIFLYVDIGQFMDKQYNTYQFYRTFEKVTYANSPLHQAIDLSCIRPIIDTIKAELSIKQDYLDIYLKRVYLSNTILFKLATELVLDLTGYKGTQYQNIIDYTICYSVILQIVNDNSDFTPKELKISTNAKKASDGFSDLKNQTLTLPLIYHLNNIEGRTRGSIFDYLATRNQDIIQNYQVEMLEELKQSKALLTSIKIGRALIPLGKSYLQKNNYTTSYLANMLLVGEWNKFYHSYDLKKYYHGNRKK